MANLGRTVILRSKRASWWAKIKIVASIVGVLLILSCSRDIPVEFPEVSEPERQAALEKWQRSCALCHVDGNGGAPKMGDREAWQPRIQQSKSVLLDHMVSGLGRMPPLGYCMDCSEQDLLVLTQFMAGDES